MSKSKKRKRRPAVEQITPEGYESQMAGQAALSKIFGRAGRLSTHLSNAGLRGQARQYTTKTGGV